MVYNGKPHEQMDDLGVALFLETPIYTKFRYTIDLTGPTIGVPKPNSKPL